MLPHSLRFFLLSAILLAFFVLSTSSSRDLQIGRYDRYIRRHAVPYAAALTYAALLGAVGVYNLVGGVGVDGLGVC